MVWIAKSRHQVVHGRKCGHHSGTEALSPVVQHFNPIERGLNNICGLGCHAQLHCNGCPNGRMGIIVVEFEIVEDEREHVLHIR
jgi:hypothetical protein